MFEPLDTIFDEIELLEEDPPHRGVAMRNARFRPYDDHPFIVLTETKFSFRCIPVGIGTLLTGLGLKKKAHVMMLSP